MEHPKIHRRSSLGVAVALLALASGPAAAQATTLVVDDDALGSATSCDDPTLTFPSISSAIILAMPGDTILVCPGTYIEEVTIPVGKNNLTLQSAIPLAAIIKAPPVMTGPLAIVHVDGATGTLIQDFKVSGPGGTTCGSIRSGIFVRSGGSATIKGNKIQDIRDNPFGGCQNGVGILVGRQLTGDTGTATIEDNEIVDYQKGGMVVDNTGSSATITLNWIVGEGPTEIIAQNGIQVSRRATAVITGNEVRNNFYLNSRAATDPNCPEGSPGPDVGGCLTTATGILFFLSGSPGDEGQLNSQNTLRRNQVNVVVIP